MVFKKRFTKKPLGKGAMAVAKRALSKVNKLDHEVERKEVTTSQATDATTTSTTAVSLATFATGTTGQLRVGDRIKPTVLEWIVNVQVTSITRLIIVQSRGSTAPTIGQVLDATFVDGFRKHDERNMVRVLLDRRFLTNTSLIAQKNIKHGFVKIPKMIQYDGVISATVPQDNGVYFFFFSDTAATTNAINFKLIFKDA